MSDADLGQFSEGFASWRQILGAVPQDDRLNVFANAAADVAGFVNKGLDKVIAADELVDIAVGCGLDDADVVQTIIGEAFKNGETEPGNGKDHALIVDASLYIVPDPKTIPRRQWLYANHYMRGIVTATVAPGGFGKTTLSLYEALTMAERGARVWYISAEDDKDEIDRRIAAHMKKHKVTPEQISGQLFVDDKVSFPLKIAKMGKTGVEFNNQALIDFEAAILRNKIDVVILDPFISFHYLPENDTAAMDALIKRLGEIATRLMIDIELSHHVRKPPNAANFEITVYDARGAGAIVNAVRSCRVLNQMSAAQARDAHESLEINQDERAKYIRIDPGKRNMAEASQAIWAALVSVEIDNGDVDHRGDFVQALSPFEYKKRSMAISDDDRIWLRTLLREKPYRQDTRSPQWLGMQIAKHFNKDAEDKRDLIWIRALITRWHKQNLIKDVELKDETRKKRKYWALGEDLDEQPDTTNEPTFFGDDNGDN